MKYILIVVLFVFSLQQLHAQALSTVKGKVYFHGGKEAVVGAQVFLENTAFNGLTNVKGAFELKEVPPGSYKLVVSYLGYATVTKAIEVGTKDVNINFSLQELKEELETVVIKGNNEQTTGIKRLNSVEGYAIYDAKKNEVVVLDDMVADKSSNNAKQVFAKVVGLNIWESDCAGLQIGVGGRGLSPNRTANFNTRQNGYDIAADALGYPETYYSPALQAVEKIEIVRGAASLQYGPQFGGLVNFEMKDGAEGKKIELDVQQTGNSLGFYNSFISVGGTVGKTNYYGYNKITTGNCWRCNSDFTSITNYGKVKYDWNEKFSIQFDFTNMAYEAKQPGGLTDNEFESNPQQSNRARNWFKVNWNLAALELSWKLNQSTKINMRNFGLMANRAALGNLTKPNRPDEEGQERSMIDGDFQNYGTEIRLLKNYNVGGNNAVLLLGGRLYKGQTLQQQGAASTGSDADFNFIQPDSLDSDYKHPGVNYSLFLENVFTLGEKWSVTPGVRYEYIHSESNGYFVNKSKDQAGNIIHYEKKEENKSYSRSILLMGIGSSFTPNSSVQFYANYSNNYRPVRFSDLRIVNNSLQIDENMKDETGFSSDIGVRGEISNWLWYDATAFFIQYNNKIGTIQKVDLENYRTYQYRTNIADSKHAGLETFLEFNLKNIFFPQARFELNWFSNVTALTAKYVSQEDATIDGNLVENVPSVIIRQGLSFSKKQFSSTLQYNFTGKQFSDASNASSTPDAVFGEIPAYYSLDVVLGYKWKKMSFTTGVNNLTNNMYFTRRAEGYPGPGIIPADGRNFHLTLGLKL